MTDISIVIVCMNNLKNLYPCLDSIRKYTKVSYETFVVAYLFSKENLAKLKKDYPWIIIIESNEIRGFSENNNLALRQAKGEYCFVVNDDTEIKMPTIDMLIDTFNRCPSNTAIVSPKLIRADGSTQYCGRPYTDWKRNILGLFHLWDEHKDTDSVDKNGIFKSYNIIGAAFLIKRSIFESVGWFDEKYFFCPEDLALSTLLNEKGYECWVNADAIIVHYEGMSGKSVSMIQTATRPAARKGSYIFYSKGKIHIFCVFWFFNNVKTLLSFLYFSIKGSMQKPQNKYSILAKGDLHILATSLSRKSPKEIFIKYYKLIKYQKT